MTIDINSVEAVSSGFVIAFWVIGSLAAILVILGILDAIWDWFAPPVFFLLAVFIGIVGSGINAVAAKDDYSNRVYDAKVIQLTETGLGHVTLSGNQFTANRGDKFIQGVLFDRGDGTFEIIETKVEK